MCVSQIVKDDISGYKVQYWVCDPTIPSQVLVHFFSGLHDQKSLSQIPQRSLSSYYERFYFLGVRGCRSFCSFGINVDFLISWEGYPKESLVGMSIHDDCFLQGGRLEFPNEV